MWVILLVLPGVVGCQGRMTIIPSLTLPDPLRRRVSGRGLGGSVEQLRGIGVGPTDCFPRKSVFPTFIEIGRL